MAKGYHNDTHALASLKQTANFVRQHMNVLSKVAPRLVTHAAEAMHHLDRNVLPPAWQMTKLELAYEKIMAAIYNDQAVDVHMDRKARGLRYG
jgi:hypothetical protein